MSSEDEWLGLRDSAPLEQCGAGAGCEELPWDIGSLDSDVTTARSIFGGADLASLVSWVPPLAGPGATSSSAHSPAGNQGAQKYSNSQASKQKRGPRPRHFAKNSCQAEGCEADLSAFSYYNMRNHICPAHLKQETIVVLGVASRFCQRCGVSHPLANFDGRKKSCRMALARHKQRRLNKQQASEIESLAALDSASFDLQLPLEFPLADGLASAAATTTQLEPAAQMPLASVFGPLAAGEPEAQLPMGPAQEQLQLFKPLEEGLGSSSSFGAASAPFAWPGAAAMEATPSEVGAVQSTQHAQQLRQLGEPHADAPGWQAAPPQPAAAQVPGLALQAAGEAAEGAVGPVELPADELPSIGELAELADMLAVQQAAEQQRGRAPARQGSSILCGPCQPSRAYCSTPPPKLEAAQPATPLEAMPAEGASGEAVAMDSELPSSAQAPAAADSSMELCNAGSSSVPVPAAPTSPAPTSPGEQQPGPPTLQVGGATLPAGTLLSVAMPMCPGQAWASTSQQQVIHLVAAQQPVGTASVAGSQVSMGTAWVLVPQQVVLQPGGL